MGFRSHLSGLDDVDAVVRVAHPEEVLPAGTGTVSIDLQS